jgi:hypothetical protein
MENNTNTKEFDHESSLKVIYEMIESAKSKIGGNYFYYLFWGYLVVATCIIEYLLISVVNYPQHYIVWSVLMPLGTIITFIFYMRQKKSVTSKSFVGTTMFYLWSGWLVSFIILLLFIILKQEYNLIFPVSMAMYGLGIFVSGGVVNFKPLLLGAIVAWMASVVAFFVPYQGQLMIMTGVVVVAYIIPGHLLKTKSKA